MFSRTGLGVLNTTGSPTTNFSSATSASPFTVALAFHDLLLVSTYATTTTQTPTSVKWGSQSMTLIDAVGRFQVWGLLCTTAGTADVTVTYASATYMVGSVDRLTGTYTPYWENSLGFTVPIGTGHITQNVDVASRTAHLYIAFEGTDSSQLNDTPPANGFVVYTAGADITLTTSDAISSGGREVSGPSSSDIDAKLGGALTGIGNAVIVVVPTSPGVVLGGYTSYDVGQFDAGSPEAQIDPAAAKRIAQGDRRFFQ